MLRALFILLILNSTPGLAATTQSLDTCSPEPKMVLESRTEIYCDGDLVLPRGLEIETNGFELVIVTEGKLHILEENLKIESSKPGSGRVTLYAGRTAQGEVVIRGTDDVEIELGSGFQYAQSIEPAPGSGVRVVVAGQELKLEGPQNKLP